MSDAKVIDSWTKNTDPWTAAVRSGEIENRRLVTNQAIVDAVRSHGPQTALDIGCGEGWLVRALDGVDMIGVDVVPGLIEEARAAAGGEFRVMSYQQIAAGELALAVDVAVCNFSLIGKDAVEGVFAAAPSFLKAHGKMIVQTLHPLAACGDAAYRDGWREGSWAGFSTGFTDPSPWYFRTIESWIALYAQNGFRLLELREPVFPASGKPASIIVIGELS